MRDEEMLLLCTIPACVCVLTAGRVPLAACSELLAAFEQDALLDSNYFFCRQDSMLAAAQLLGKARPRGKAQGAWVLPPC